MEPSSSTKSNRDVINNSNNASSAPASNVVHNRTDALALQLLEDAIVQIPLHEKAEYVEALRLCPHLIEEESDPLLFLQYEQYNTWAAARRLVKYWEWRAILFNRQAYKPILDLKTFDDGDDKNTEFLEIVKDGGAVLLSGKDVDGNSLILVDRSRFRLPFELMDSYRILQLMFFTHTRAIQSIKQGQQESNYLSSGGRVLGGLRVLNVVQIKAPPRHFLAIQKDMESLIFETFPFEFKSVVLLFVPNTERPGWTRFIDNVLPFCASVLFKAFHFTKIIPIFKFDKQDIPKALEPYGIPDKSMLPESIGGTWSYGNFDRWLQDNLHDRSEISSIDNNLQDHRRNKKTSVQKRRIDSMESGSYRKSSVNSISDSEHIDTSNNEAQQPLSSRSSKRTRKFPLKLQKLASSEETRATIENLQASLSVDLHHISTQQWSVIDYWRQRIHPKTPETEESTQDSEKY